jgi:hypothetical protein
MEQIQRKQLTEVLTQVALLESKEIAVNFAEIIAHLQKSNHLTALGTLKGIEDTFEFLGVILSTAARLSS